MTTDAPVVAAKGRDPAATAASLAPWLSDRLGISSVEVRDLTYPRGAGFSNETILFEARTPDIVEDLVLRIAPRPDYQMFMDPEFAMQYRLITALRQGGRVNVPETLWFEEDAGVLGQPFFVMRRMRGRVPVSIPVYNSGGWLFDAGPGQRHTAWRNAVHQLAAIHTVPLDDVAFVGESPCGRRGLSEQLAYWVRFASWAFAGPIPDRLETILDWLAGNIPPDGEPTLSWGDARMGNMMFDEHFCVMGVMDWEQASLAGPMTDVAWWLMFDEMHSSEVGLTRLEGLGTRAETIALWQELTGLVVSDLLWHEVFAAVKTGLLATRSRVLRTTGTADGRGTNIYFSRVCRQLDLPPWEENG